MINVNINKFSTAKISSKLKQISNIEVPTFHTYKPDFKSIEKIAKKYSKFKNYLILANGGSRTSSLAFYELSDKKKKFKFIPTMEPDFLNKIAKEFSKKDTLVIPISKSGTNVCPLESMFFFMNKGYKILPLTSKDTGTLKEIAKIKGYDIAVHPNIGGRYSGRTMCGLLPAKLMGLDIKKINKGAIKMYKLCHPKNDIQKNPALRIASYLYLHELKGYSETFLAVYSTKFAGFIPLIVQLMHESFGKEGKGLTFFGDLGPEMQHHTNQRFYGGKKNIIGMFIGVDKEKDTKIKVPKSLEKTPLRSGTLKVLNNLSLSKALSFELKANLLEVKSRKIPLVDIKISEANEYTFGEFMALMQYVAVYSSYLRNVNPFDQPEVEHSKEVSFQMALNF